MKKHISFPSIERFANIVANVNREYNFVGLDDNGDAIYDHSKPKPVLTFKGTVKLHGTNAAVSFTEGDYWVQSRENIITPEKDNAGFAFFVESKKEVFKDFVTKINSVNFESLHDNTFTIYGEWCGGSIQKGVAICGLPKSFFIFALKVTPHNGERPAYWIPCHYLKSPENNIYNIEDYESYSIDIDFNNPQLVQNKIIEMTLKVEDECPVGKAFDISGVGEGIVFSHMTADGKVYRFKSKGEKHAKGSKVTTLKPVDDVKLNKIIEVVNAVTPDWRLQQAMEKTFDFMNGGKIDIKRMGDFIRNVIADILKEELDTLAAAGLEPKDINSKVSERSRLYFFAKQSEELGLN